MTQSRQPAGVPVGGQFAPDTRPRSGIDLEAGLDPIEPLAWEDDLDQPDQLDQRATSDLGADAYYSLGPDGRGGFSAGLVANDGSGAPVPEWGEGLGSFDTEDEAKAACAEHEANHAGLKVDGSLTDAEHAAVEAVRETRQRLAAARADLDRMTAGAVRDLVLARHPDAAYIELDVHGADDSRHQSYSFRRLVNDHAEAISTTWDNGHDDTLDVLLSGLNTDPSTTLASSVGTDDNDTGHMALAVARWSAYPLSVESHRQTPMFPHLAGE